ncbi:thiamine-phosphate kinase [Geoalkalibacter subterraneus]|uniref:Thiamine-monophosphate kinase n=1 Tax=Geoalkalibacter subterraneus TaxID=483547 RepID=A0A0B5FSU7_9BACT|nr:thiamine-phosphate kinase [Geoalkalibacter subterraneus]AJF07729.1 thiamine-monophosphate kinase [Geoalkalibacter subterraneus]
MSPGGLGEFEFIERLRRRCDPNGALVRGIGDDCAVARVPAGELLLTSTDLLIEDVHFRTAWIDMHDLGRKSVSVNVSDVAAMGGQPLSLFLALGIPADLSLEDLDRFTEGVLSACRDYGAVLAGGDTCRSPRGLFISVTVEGAVPDGLQVTRDGARPGDLVWVSGTLGDSALALRELLAGRQPPEECLRRHHDPRARVELGRTLAAQRFASAMIDISDGLFSDLGHILDASGCGAVLRRDLLPLSPAFLEFQQHQPEVNDLALTGGEDYELLFTSPPQHAEAVRALATPDLPLTEIGQITVSTDGLRIVDAQGTLRMPTRSGFDHFA